MVTQKNHLNKYPHKFWMRNKKNNFLIHTLKETRSVTMNIFRKKIYFLFKSLVKIE